MKRKQAWAYAILIALLSLGVGCSRQSKKPTPIAPVEPAPGATGLPVSGRPAIPLVGNQAITEAQVRSYVLSHRVPRALEATNMAIVSINFISSQQVRDLLHSANLGVLPQEPMCLVVLSGRFVFPGPPGVTPTFPIAVEVFNARTGNLVQSGGLPRAPQESTP